MRLRTIYPALLVCCGLAMAGCGTLIEPGAPDQSFDVDEDIQALEEVFAEGMTIKDFYKKEIDETTKKVSFPNKTKENRDQFIATRLTLMNIQYIKFIRRFAAEKAQLDSAADILVEGLGLAGALVGAASTKAILAAISTGTSASRTSINKNFFHEQTVPVLITAMNATRKEALIPILEGQSKSLDEYPFSRALSDLNFYYHAGTFIGALQEIQKDAGVQEQIADDKIEDLFIAAGAIPQDVRKRRVIASNVIWDWHEEEEFQKLRNLAIELGSRVEELGELGDEIALDRVLDEISVARTEDEIKLIEEAIERVVAAP